MFPYLFGTLNFRVSPQFEDVAGLYQLASTVYILFIVFLL